MDYLIVAHRATADSYWDALLLANGTLCHSSAFKNFGIDSFLFDTYVSTMTLTEEKKLTLEKIANPNVRDGYIAFDEVTADIELLMRRLGFRKCDICGTWVTPQDCNNSNRSFYDRHLEQRYCPICLAKKQGEENNTPVLELSAYHSTSRYARVINGNGENFTLSNVKGIGIEMEYNNRRGDYRIVCTKEFYELAKPNGRNRVFRCETDATVSGEIISNVFTKKSLYDFNWKILTNQLELLGNDESMLQVGLHVHFSKTLLGDNPITQCVNFLKLQYVLKCYEDDFKKVSGRASNDTQWCAFYSFETINTFRTRIENATNANSIWSVFPTAHGYALISSVDSDGNSPTIELRIGKSTNDPVRLTNYLKLVFGLVENIANVPFAKCYCLNKIFRLVPNEVMNYWRSKGCFMTTNAKDIRGVEFRGTQARQ